jgi:hypothetical protein
MGSAAQAVEIDSASRVSMNFGAVRIAKPPAFPVESCQTVEMPVECDNFRKIKQKWPDRPGVRHSKTAAVWQLLRGRILCLPITSCRCCKQGRLNTEISSFY